jgi:NADH-quinone oxidoreductase subunit G
MPTIYIDNKKIEAENNESVILAAAKNGIDIPHFCWHPELSISGNCRMCLVEIGNPKKNPDGSFVLDENGNKVINYMPKLQIACNTFAAENLYVRTNTQKVIDAREAVMEFLLINHPLDCPICDEAGQCKLQQYSDDFGKGKSRFVEEKNPNPKHVKWNEKIIHDAERCISCSRCIRFMNEIANEKVLTFINRGDKVRIERFEDAKIQSDYSMNIIDGCPVGALTSADFRFKARVWEMSFNNSICPICAKGCNIRIGVRNGEVLRIEPLNNSEIKNSKANNSDTKANKNPEANKNWICDTARLALPNLINEKRLTNPQIRKNGLNNSTFEEAISAAVSLLKKYKSDEIYFIASALASNEANSAFSELAKKIKTQNIGYISRIDENFADNFLKQNDKSPNKNGVENLGIKPINQTELIEKITSKAIKAVFVLDEDFEFCKDLVATFRKLDSLIICTFKENLANKFADILFSVACFAEYSGSFTNFQNIIQTFKPAIIYKENYEITENLNAQFFELNRSRLDIFGSHNDKWNQKVARNIKPSSFIINEILKRIS